MTYIRTGDKFPEIQKLPQNSKRLKGVMKKVDTEDPKLLCVAVKYLVAMATWWTEIVQLCVRHL